MKWFKVPATWFHSETAQLLKNEFGREGPALFIELISIIATEISSDEDIQFLYSFGWKKPVSEWRRLLGISPKKFIILTEILENSGKLRTKFDGIFLYFYITQLHEFIDLRAISSKYRPKAGAQLKDSWAPAGRIREEKSIRPAIQHPSANITAAALAPLQGGGHSSALQAQIKKPQLDRETEYSSLVRLDRSGWKISKREAEIEQRWAEKQKRIQKGEEEGREEIIFGEDPSADRMDPSGGPPTAGLEGVVVDG